MRLVAEMYLHFYSVSALGPSNLLRSLLILIVFGRIVKILRSSFTIYNILHVKYVIILKIKNVHIILLKKKDVLLFYLTFVLNIIC